MSTIGVPFTPHSLRGEWRGEGVGNQRGGRRERERREVTIGDRIGNKGAQGETRQTEEQADR